MAVTIKKLLEDEQKRRLKCDMLNLEYDGNGELTKSLLWGMINMGCKDMPHENDYTFTENSEKPLVFASSLSEELLNMFPIIDNTHKSNMTKELLGKYSCYAGEEFEVYKPEFYWTEIMDMESVGMNEDWEQVSLCIELQIPHNKFEQLGEICMLRAMIELNESRIAKLLVLGNKEVERYLNSGTLLLKELQTELERDKSLRAVWNNTKKTVLSIEEW